MRASARSLRSLPYASQRAPVRDRASEHSCRSNRLARSGRLRPRAALAPVRDLRERALLPSHIGSLAPVSPYARCARSVRDLRERALLPIQTRHRLARSGRLRPRAARAPVRDLRERALLPTESNRLRSLRCLRTRATRAPVRRLRERALLPTRASARTRRSPPSASETLARPGPPRASTPADASVGSHAPVPPYARRARSRPAPTRASTPADADARNARAGRACAGVLRSSGSTAQPRFSVTPNEMYGLPTRSVSDTTSPRCRLPPTAAITH